VDVLIYNMVTGALMVLLIKSATFAVPKPPPSSPGSSRSRRVPWTAITLTALLVAGLVLQASWSGAMDTLDSDPSRTGWWRPLTSVFMQSSGVVGDVFNLVTLAALATLAEWCWGSLLTAGVFLCGALLPHVLDLLIGTAGRSTEPRNFAGSSGATYFLGAALAGWLLLSTRDTRQRLVALAVPLLGVGAWFTQHNGHGLVAAEGFALGLVLWIPLHHGHDPRRTGASATRVPDACTFTEARSLETQPATSAAPGSPGL
jgi:hypothetical protein